MGEMSSQNFRHFMDELLEHVQTLPDQLHCHECNYKGDRPQNLVCILISPQFLPWTEC